MPRPEALKRLDKNPITLDRMLRNWQRLHYRGFADAMPVFEPIYIQPGDTPAESGIALRYDIDYGLTTVDTTDAEGNEIKTLSLALADASLEFVADTGVRVNLLSTGAIALDATNGLYVDANMPLFADATGLSIVLGTDGGLGLNGSGHLGIITNDPLYTDAAGLKLRLLADGGLYVTSTALSVKLAATSGLEFSTGLKIDVADNSLGLAAAGISVTLDPSEPGLQKTSGLKVLLASSSGLELSSGLKIDPADVSLTLAAGGVSVNNWSTGGIATDSSNGLYLKAIRQVSSDPAGLTDGQIWYRTDLETLRIRRGSDTQEISALIYTNTAKSAAICDSTSSAEFFDKYGTIKQDLFANGKSFRMTAYGTYTNPSGGTIRLRIMLGGSGGTEILDTGALTAGSSGTRNWSITCEFVVADTGTGQIYSGGFASVQDTHIPIAKEPVGSFAADKTVELEARFSTTHASQGLTLFKMTLESIN